MGMRILHDGCLKKVTCPKGHAITVADAFPYTYTSLFCAVCQEKYDLKPGMFDKTRG